MKEKTYYIITIGCQMNKSDSERIAGHLEGLEYKATDDRNRADLVVVNTCGVRQSAEDRVYGLVNKIRQENPRTKIVITGCLAEREDVKKKLGEAVDLWLPIGKFLIFNFQFSNNFQISNSKFQIDAAGDCQTYLSVKPKYSSSISAYVPIGNGCDNFCAYCVVPYARGREVWRPAEDIVEEVRGLVGRGYKEITLIAQNVNSYKSEILNPKFETNSKFKIQNSKINFSRLLYVINDIPGKFWIRFATSHPKDMSDELIHAVAECDKICEHVHLPVQAGDDGILRRMNRGYTAERYKSLIEKIRKNVKCQTSPPKAGPPLAENVKCSVTTDVIVGFPGETEEQFNNTVKLFEEVKFDMAYIAQYSPRPGTVAAKLEDDVPKGEKKRREAVLTGVLRRMALENNREYIGKVAEVLVEGKNRKGEWCGRTRTSKNVKIRSAGRRINGKCEKGEFVDVKIVEAKDFGLAGDLVK